MKNGLYIVATPIGNIGDISPRARETLAEADVIACEDTRISKKLFALLGLSLQKRFITLHDHNEDSQLDLLINLIKKENCAVALISDAGSPLISDPGYKLIRRCRAENIYITTLPGCCALICALQLSGLPTNRFMFAGFIPNKDKARHDLFKALKQMDSTLIFYETANRIVKTLNVVAEVFGSREVAVCREITKMFEECLNGTAAELIEHFSTNEPKGEMVLMIAPPAEIKSVSEMDLDSVLRERLKNSSLKSAVKEVVEIFGLNKNDVYQRALEIKNEQ